MHNFAKNPGTEKGRDTQFPWPSVCHGGTHTAKLTWGQMGLEVSHCGRRCWNTRQEGQDFAGSARGSLPGHLPADQHWQNLGELTRPRVHISAKDYLQFMKVSSPSGVNNSCSSDSSREPPVHTSGGTGSFHSRSHTADTTQAQKL